MSVQTDDITPNNKHVLAVVDRANGVQEQIPFKEDAISQIAFYNEIPVGYVLAEQQDNVTVVVHSLQVLEGYRNLGIEAKLLAFVQDATKSKFIHNIVYHIRGGSDAEGSVFEQNGYTKQNNSYIKTF